MENQKKSNPLELIKLILSIALVAYSLTIIF